MVHKDSFWFSYTLGYNYHRLDHLELEILRSDEQWVILEGELARSATLRLLTGETTDRIQGLLGKLFDTYYKPTHF